MGRHWGEMMCCAPRLLAEEGGTAARPSPHRNNIRGHIEKESGTRQEQIRALDCALWIVLQVQL